MTTPSAFVSVSSRIDITATPQNVTLPTCSEGDHLLIAVVARGGNPSASGFTAYTATAGSGGYFAVASFLHKIATSTDSGATLSLSSGFPAVAWIIVARPAKRSNPVGGSGIADSGVTEVSSLAVVGPTGVSNPLNFSVWASTDDTAPEDQTLSNGSTVRASYASSGDALAGLVAEDSLTSSTSRSSSTASSGLMAAVTVSLPGAGGQQQIM